MATSTAAGRNLGTSWRISQFCS